LGEEAGFTGKLLIQNKKITKKCKA